MCWNGSEGARGLPGRRAANGRLEPPLPGRAFKKTECGCLSLLRPCVLGVRWAPRLHLRTEDAHLAAHTASAPPPTPAGSPSPPSSPCRCSRPALHTPVCPVCPSVCHLHAYILVLTHRPPACASLFPSVSPSLRPSSFCLCFHLSMCLSCPYLPPTCLSTHLSICPSAYPSFRPPFCLPPVLPRPVSHQCGVVGLRVARGSSRPLARSGSGSENGRPRLLPGAARALSRVPRWGGGGRRRDPADLRGGGTPGQFLPKERLWPLWKRSVTAEAPSPAAVKPQGSSVKFAARAPTHGRGGGVSPCPGFLSCQRGSAGAHLEG